MDWLIWPGAFVSILGVAGLVYCIKAAMDLRKEDIEREEATARMHKIVAMNMGALAFSAIGLMMVVVGILLG